MNIKKSVSKPGDPKFWRTREFGGYKSSVRRVRCLAYAWREHRRRKTNVPFMFTIVGSAKRRDGTRAPRSVVGFVTHHDRELGIKYLITQGFNHFTVFRDVNAHFALQYGIGNNPDQVVVNR